jgi:hypothetical protein
MELMKTLQINRVLAGANYYQWWIQNPDVVIEVSYFGAEFPETPTDEELYTKELEAKTELLKQVNEKFNNEYEL